MRLSKLLHRHNKGLPHNSRVKMNIRSGVSGVFDSIHSDKNSQESMINKYAKTSDGVEHNTDTPL